MKKSVSLAEGFLASRSAEQVREEAKKMIVSSGTQCSELSTGSDRFMSLQKMLLTSTSLGYSIKSMMKWKPSDTKYGHLKFQLRQSGRLISEEELGQFAGQKIQEKIRLGLLRTPDAGMARGNYRAYALKKRVDKGLIMNLNTQMKAFVLGLLPTQRGALCTNATYTPAQDKRHTSMVKDLAISLGKRHGFRLRPEFTEWMMGFPEGWTNIDETEENE